MEGTGSREGRAGRQWRADRRCSDTRRLEEPHIFSVIPGGRRYVRARRRVRACVPAPGARVASTHTKWSDKHASVGDLRRHILTPHNDDAAAAEPSSAEHSHPRSPPIRSGVPPISTHTHTRRNHTGTLLAFSLKNEHTKSRLRDCFFVVVVYALPSLLCATSPP